MVNYKDWISEIEIKTYYFSAFIKALIAFNSWYKDGYNAWSNSDIKVVVK